MPGASKLIRFFGKAGKGLYETVKSPSVKENFKVGVSRLVKYGGTGVAAAAVGAGTGFALSHVGSGLEELGVKKPSPADAMKAEADAMMRMNEARKAMFDEAMRENKAINLMPTLYGGLGPYGYPELYGRDALLKNGGTADTSNNSGTNWGMIILIVLAALGGYLAFKKLKK